MFNLFRRKKPDEVTPSDTKSDANPQENAQTAIDHSPEFAAASNEVTRDSAEALLALSPTVEQSSPTVEPAIDQAEITTEHSQSEHSIEAADAPAMAIPDQDHSTTFTPDVFASSLEQEKASWRERLRDTGFARGISGLFSRNPALDEDLLDEIETALLTADVGVTATTELIEKLRKRMKAREFVDANALLTALRGELIDMLRPVSKPLILNMKAKPFVILTIGVNGVGKTTTIGKLANRFKEHGHQLMLAAGDTFRAAAVAQLQTWGERNGVTVVAQGQNADAAAVAFDALQSAKSRQFDILIADTAGRLHTQQGLMAELTKIKRVLSKIDEQAPHEVLMVIDGTTGQNAISQLRQFHAAAGVTGLVVTKLDGTAKGGVVFALAREFGIPIRYAGIGERPEDLKVFHPEAFVDAILPRTFNASAAPASSA